MTRETIHYTITTSTLGQVLVARSAAGICAIYINNHAQLLIGELETDFPVATIVRDDKNMAPLAAIISGHINQPATPPALTLDLRGSAFQRRVWGALQQIPAGQTCSYTQLAHQLGIIKGARAVASACAANRIAVIIPCHRVIGSSGALSGYRWGIERKQQLLALENNRD